VACVLLAGGWVLAASRDAGSETSKARVQVEADAPPTVSAPPGSGRNAPVKVAGRVLVRAVDARDARLNGQVAEATLGLSAGAREAGSLACQRVHMAAHAGLCLALAPSGVEYRARIFDGRFKTRHDFALTGLPSRARVSPSGRWGAITTFVSGDAYAEAGEFSTRTSIVDMRAGRPITDLEKFEVRRGTSTIDSPDFNFWGVTFARDDDTFYATLATGGQRYLVKGSIDERTVELLRENVECPSLSPDGTRIAYKKRVGGVEDWRLHVLELASGRDVALSERRSIDDQVEWLTNGAILYGDERSVWAVRADGGGRPRRILTSAASPTALR
jgi:dipeptidyl aminopeptidase/acylaminoacyl peptidase